MGEKLTVRAIDCERSEQLLTNVTTEIHRDKWPDKQVQIVRKKT